MLAAVILPLLFVLLFFITHATQWAGDLFSVTRSDSGTMFEETPP